MTTQSPEIQKSKKADKSTAPVKAGALVPAAEEGFKRDVAIDIAGFYDPNISGADGKPAKFRGLLLGTRERPQEEDDKKLGKDPQLYFLVQLTAPSLANDADAPKGVKQIVELPAGAILWVDVRFDMQRALGYLPRRDMSGMPTMTEIIYEPTKKIAIGGGRTMWKGDLQHRHIRGSGILELGYESLIPERAAFSSQPVRQIGVGGASPGAVDFVAAHVDEEIPF